MTAQADEHRLDPVEDEEESGTWFSTIIALLIAAVSVAGAIVAWRASVSADGAGDADTAGLRATINLSETRALAAVNVYDDYASFVEYYVNRGISQRLEQALFDLPTDSPAETLETLQTDLADNMDLTSASQLAFPNQFLNRDGTYAFERQRGEILANAARQRDLNPQPSYDEADTLRQQTNNLLIALTVLAIGLVFYTFIEAFENRLLRYTLTLGGTVLFIVGVGMVYLIETGRL